MKPEWIVKHKAGIEKALDMDGRRYTFVDIARALVNNTAQGWINEDACVITEIRQSPRQKTLHFWLATGKKDAVIDLQRRACEWARDTQGCTRATLAGRKGWLRVGASEGWRESTLVFMEKPL